MGRCHSLDQYTFLSLSNDYHSGSGCYENAKIQTQFQNNSGGKVTWGLTVTEDDVRIDQAVIDVSKMMEGCPAHMSNLPRSAAKSYNLRSK